MPSLLTYSPLVAAILAIYALTVTLSGVDAAFNIDLQIGTLQSAGANGSLVCKGKPYKGAIVRLYDVDTLDPDDLMGETKTDEDGNFFVTGKESETTQIDPKLRIYHKCGYEAEKCHKEFGIILPNDYVTQGPKPERIFDAGIINLAAFVHKEDCSVS